MIYIGNTKFVRARDIHYRKIPAICNPNQPIHQDF